MPLATVEPKQGDASRVLEAAEHDLDLVASAIEGGVVRDRYLAVAFFPIAFLAHWTACRIRLWSVDAYQERLARGTDSKDYQALP
jgi:hypothetical protein